MTEPDTQDSQRRPRFGRAARWSLALALLLMGLSAAQLAYRYFLPTDGWLVVAEDLSAADLMYYANLVGAPSGVLAEDIVTGVEGTPLGAFQTGETPPFWYAGNVLSYDVRRGGQTLTVAVPIVHWTLAGIARGMTVDPSQFISLVGVLILLGVSLLAFFKRPEDPAARALLIFVAAIAAQSISSLLPDGLSTSFDPLANVAVGFFSYMIFGVVFAPSLLSFTLVFPHPKPVIVRHPWLAYTPFLIGAVILVVLVTANTWQVGWFGTLFMLLASLVSLVHSVLTMRDVVSRAQLLWAFGGILLGIGLFLLNFPSAFGWVGDWAYGFTLLASAGIPVMGLGLAIAVLRYRLFDIEVIFRRTTAYAILTALLALIYFGSVVLLQRLFGQVTGEQSTAAVVLSTLLIAALFLPLRRRVQSAIDRRFFRRKYDAEKTLEAFAATVRNEPDLDALTTELVRVIQETMQPEHVSVWLRPVERAEHYSASRELP